MLAIDDRDTGITEAQRAALRSDGFVIVPGALSPDVVARLTGALGRIHAEELLAGRVGRHEPMHLLGQLGRDPAFLELLDHPSVFPVLWGELGWNIHVYHCHLDVTPPRETPREQPFWGWHQDGGRQNLELDGEPRPRLSLKVAYWLSDLSAPGRGNMLVLPGSHERNVLPRPGAGDHAFEQPAGAVPVMASPGDALIFDRRLWHSRSDNLSDITRRAIFLAYTYRWIRPRDDLGVALHELSRNAVSPIRRQLLGEPASPHSHWGLGEHATPLQSALQSRRLLNPAIPSHR
jgi:hypothetical protein